MILTKKVILFTHLKHFSLVTDTDCAIGEVVAGVGPYVQWGVRS